MKKTTTAKTTAKPSVVKLAECKPRYPFTEEYIGALLDEMVRLGIVSKHPVDGGYWKNRVHITETEQDQLTAFEDDWHLKRGILPLAFTDTNINN